MSGRSHNSHDDWILPFKKRLVRIWKDAEDPSFKLASSSEQHDQQSKEFRPRNSYEQVLTPPYSLHHDVNLKNLKTTRSNILTHDDGPPLQHASTSNQPHQWSRAFRPWCAHEQDKSPQLSLHLDADRKNTSSDILNLEEDPLLELASTSHQPHQWNRTFSPCSEHGKEKSPHLSLHLDADIDKTASVSILNHEDPSLQSASTSDQPDQWNRELRSWSFPEQENVPQNSLHLDATDLKRTTCVNNLYQEAQWSEGFRPWSSQEQQNVPQNAVHCDASSIPVVRESSVEEAWHSSGSENPQPSSAVSPLPGTSSAGDLQTSLCSNNGHNLKKQHKCQHCNRTFTSVTSKRSHVSVHSEKLLKCHECGRCFRTRYDLTRHQRVHTGERPYTCSMCGATFTQTSNLFYHMRIHTGEKPYQCNVCEREFRGSSHLKRHMRHHTGEKPYSCSDCLAVFASWDELNRHRNREHFQNK